MTATISTRQQLHDIVDLSAHLSDLLTSRGSATGGQKWRSPGFVAHSPSPVRLDVLQALDGRCRVAGDDAEDRAWHDRMASEHRQGLLPDLWQWARMIEAEAMDTCPDLQTELPEVPTVASVATWLLAHLDWALTQRWSGELVADVDWWWRRIRQLTGEREDYVPRCPACLFPVTNAGANGGIWRCDGCHAETSIDAALRRLAEPLVTLGQAANLTGTPRGTLKQWVADGRLLPLSGTTPVVYRLRDIHALLDTPPQRGRPARAV